MLKITTGYYFRSVTIVFLAFLSMSAVHADETHDLAKASQNPISSLVSVPFEFNNNFNTGPEDAYFQQLLGRDLVFHPDPLATADQQSSPDTGQPDQGGEEERRQFV